MGLFKKRPKTSEQKAQKAQMGIAVRIIGCAYLIYVVIQMFKSAPENDSISPTLKYIIAAVFLAAAIFIILATIREFIRNMKAGYYQSSAYADDVNEDSADEADSIRELPEQDESADTSEAPDDAGTDGNTDTAADAEKTSSDDT